MIGLETGHPAEALKEASTALTLDPANPRTLGEAGYVLASLRRTAQAEQLLAALKQLSGRGMSVATFPALVELGLGRRDEALDELQNMMNEPQGAGLRGLWQWHGFEDLRTDPRFRELLAQEQRDVPGI